MISPRNAWVRIRGAPLLIAFLALALYLPAFWWGAPHATAPDRIRSWGTDDISPLGPLADIHNLIEPKADRNLGYPLMSSFIFSAAYMPYLGYLYLTGKFVAISVTYPYGLIDPVGTLEALTWIAHLVSVLMGVGIVLAAYDAGRTLWGRRTGIFSALFVMLSFPMFYYARTGNVDILVLLFTALALDAFAHCIVKGFTPQRAAWLGASVGFALGTKEPAFASFLAIPIVLVVLHWRRRKTGAGLLSWDFWKSPLIALLASIVAFGLGSGLFLSPERYLAHIQFSSQRLRLIQAGNVAFLQSYPFTWEGHIQLALRFAEYLVDTMTLSGLLLAFLGLLWTLRREPLTATFALPALTYMIVLFWSARTAQLRYLMPPAFTLAFFAGRAVAVAWESRWRSIRVGFAMLAFGIIAVSLLRGVDLTHAMINDARYPAAAWLDRQTQPGDRVEHFGHPGRLPPLKGGVTTTPAIGFYSGTQRPRIDEEAVQEIAQGWRERKPDFIIIMPDYISPTGVPYSAFSPPPIYEGLLNETLGYREAAYFETPPLFPWVRRPALDYPSVNPPIRIFVQATQPGTG